MRIPWLPSKPVRFPDPRQAAPNGLLAAGGALSTDWLLTAYESGIFPWFDDDAGPILWWSPDPRGVFFLDRIHISRSLRKRIRQQRFRVTLDEAFDAVVRGCAAPEHRQPGTGTWITRSMHAAYGDLHRLGYAHSVEVWQGDELAGGMYGVSLGQMFFGESMFSAHTDGSKIALVYLAAQLQRWQFTLLDCQLMNDHLATLGARLMLREDFLSCLAANRGAATRLGRWTLDADLDPLEPWHTRRT